MEETSEVKGPSLEVGLAGMLDELNDDFVELKLLRGNILCGFLIANAVTKDVQKESFVHDSAEDR